MTQLSIVATLFALACVGPGCGDDDDSDSGLGAAGAAGQAGARAGDKAGAGAGARAGRSAAGVGGAAPAPAAGAGNGAQISGSTAEGQRAVTLQFKAKLGDEDFACDREYPDLGTNSITAKPQDFRFFVQEVRLITREGEAVPLVLDERAPVQTRDVALLDFTRSEGLCHAGGDVMNTQITGRAPEGEYDGVEFVIGVPDSLNHQDITRAKDPLRDLSAHWGWLNGYRFIMAELSRIEPEPEPDAGVPQNPVTLIHVGSGACSGTPSGGFRCSRENRPRIRVTGFDPLERAVIADFAQLFARTDLSTGLQCHGVSDPCKPMYEALGLDMGTGRALPEQRVFRAE